MKVCSVVFSEVVCVCFAGTDEHGLKIQQAAGIAGKDPLSFCTEVSESFKDVFQRCGISYTDYIRTTEQRHRRAVEHFWTVLHSKGFIYKGTYEGWYSTPDESFLTPTQVTDSKDSTGSEIKISTESGHKVCVHMLLNILAILMGYIFCLPETNIGSFRVKSTEVFGQRSFK